LLISTVRTGRGIVDESTNLGFFSDPKLMNTAMSRAADFVAVVGDPLALCTTGSCRKVWHDYIEACSRQGGLFPATVTMDWIYLQLRQFDGCTVTRRKDSDDLSPDEILEELARQAAGIPPSATGCPIPFTIDFDEGYGVLSVPELPSSDVTETVKKRSADDVSSDRDVLLGLVRDQPDKYVACKLDIVSHDNIRAHFIDNPVRQKMVSKGVPHVVIKGRANCERALHSDEVVIELLECENDAAVGRVCGVLRECVSRKNLVVICAADGNTCTQGVVKPLDDSMPCFQTLTQKKDLDKVKKRGFISVYSFRGDRPEFCRSVKLNLDRPNNMLLEVRYLKWKRDSRHPLGVVTREIPLGVDFDSAVKILAINCQIRQRFPAKALAEVDEAVRHYSAERFFESFKDFTDIRVFTIDGEKAEDLDDAVSLLMLDGETCRIGVHIVDVAWFVEKGSCVDNEAFERLETFYRDDSEDPLIPMLPHRLSTDLCSLLPDRQRPVVSFWYKVELGTGKIIDFNISRSLVKSCKKFSYQEVNNILDKKSSSEYDEELRHLFKVTQAWSKRRGNRTGCFFTANKVVEELMKQVNKSAASLVMDKFSDCVPLYTNQTCVSPEPEQICGNGTFDAMSGHLSQTDSDESFLLLKPIWWKIMKEVVAGKFTDVRALLHDTEGHGHDLWHYLDWSDDDSQKIYRCSGSVDDDTLEQKYMYMRMTSPMRRYMDLVSLRMLVAVIEGQTHSPYTGEEMEQLCQHANDGLLQKTKCEHEIQVLRRAVELKNRAAVMFPYVSSFTDSSLSLRFPSVISRRPELQNLRYSGLDLVQTPVVHDLVTLNWKQRVYDLKNSYRTTASVGGEFALPNKNERYCYRLPTNVWKSVLE